MRARERKGRGVGWDRKQGCSRREKEERSESEMAQQGQKTTTTDDQNPLSCLTIYSYLDIFNIFLKPFDLWPLLFLSVCYVSPKTGNVQFI